MTTSRREQAIQLRDRVRDFYCKPGEITPGVVFLTEINAPHSARRADGLAVHLTRARPWIDGIEIKVSRSDWLAELDDHTKADGWFGHTHRWWIAANPDIVLPDEVPHGWGLMVPNPRSHRLMTTVIKPAVREADVSYPVLCEILKKVDNQRAQQLRHAIDGITDKARSEAEAQFRAQLDRARQNTVSITDRSDRDLGQQLRQATDTGHRQIRAALEDPTISRIIADLVLTADQRSLIRYTGDLHEAARRHERAAAALHTAAEAAKAVWPDAS